MRNLIFLFALAMVGTASAEVVELRAGHHQQHMRKKKMFQPPTVIQDASIKSVDARFIAELYTASPGGFVNLNAAYQTVATLTITTTRTSDITILIGGTSTITPVAPAVAGLQSSQNNFQVKVNGNVMLGGQDGGNFYSQAFLPWTKTGALSASVTLFGILPGTYTINLDMQAAGVFGANQITNPYINVMRKTS